MPLAMLQGRDDRRAIEGPSQTLSYGELRNTVERLAGTIETAARPGSVVAVHGVRSVAYVVAALAVFEARCALVSIDENMPDDAKRELIRAVRPHCVIATDEKVPALAMSASVELTMAGTVLRGPVRETPAVFDRPGCELPDAEIVYAFTTSGTTGARHVVYGTSAALSDYVLWHRTMFGLTAEDRVPLIASLSFDAVLKEMLPILAAGGTLLIPPMRAPYRNIAALGRWFSSTLPTVLHVVPSIGTSIRRFADPPDLRLPSLRAITCSGEALSWPAADEIRLLSGRSDARLFNAYGTTEMTILQSAFEALPEAACTAVPHDPVPVGSPRPGYRIDILSQDGRNASDGVEGDVVVRGAGTYSCVRGRWQQRMEQRTGDRAVRRDGILTILGRSDRSFKRHGERIVPEQLEAAIASHPAVASAYVMRLEDETSDAAPVAFVVAPGAMLSHAALKEQLLRTFSPSQIPVRFYELETMPLTVNGKIDHEALRRSAREEKNDAVLTADERAIAEIFGQLTGRAITSASDDFFQAGGHSLLAIKLVAALRRRFGRSLPLALVFAHSSVRELAALIRAGKQPV